MNLKDKKSEIRRAVLNKRSSITDQEIESCASGRLEPLLSFIREITGKEPGSLTVMSYMSYKTEFPTNMINNCLLENGAKLAVPYTGSDFRIISCLIDSVDGLSLSKMGIPEPDPEKTEHIDASDADIILMPGTVFDRSGSRIGYGKGCYDRFLAEAPGKLPQLAALAWSVQVADSVPQDESDIRCDYIFTENEIINCRSQR